MFYLCVKSMVFFAYKNWGESIADVIFMTIAANKLSKKGGKRLEIEKIINNNIIRSSDDLNHEVLVMGCGIGYLKKLVWRSTQKKSIKFIDYNPSKP